MSILERSEQILATAIHINIKCKQPRLPAVTTPTLASGQRRHQVRISSALVVAALDQSRTLGCFPGPGTPDARTSKTVCACVWIGTHAPAEAGVEEGT